MEREVVSIPAQSAYYCCGCNSVLKGAPRGICGKCSSNAVYPLANWIRPLRKATPRPPYTRGRQQGGTPIGKNVVAYLSGRGNENWL